MSLQTGLVTRFAAWVLCLCVLAACAVKLESDYDAVFDQRATALQESVEVALIRLAAPDTADRSYAAFSDFYTETQASLVTLETRAATHPDNQRTQDILNGIEENIDSMKMLHMQDNLTPEDANDFRDILHTQFSALIALETAKMRQG